VPRVPKLPRIPKTPVLRLAPVTPDKARARLPMGSFTWRQGFIWWTIHPPYRGRKDMFPSREPPPGATVVKGPGSAYKTITKLGVNVPKEVLIDLGIQDIRITKHGGGIQYRRDIKQKTKLGYPIGMPPGIAGLRER